MPLITWEIKKGSWMTDECVCVTVYGSRFVSFNAKKITYPSSPATLYRQEDSRRSKEMLSPSRKPLEKVTKWQNNIDPGSAYK